MVTLLGVAMTTAGSCDSSSNGGSHNGIDSTAIDTTLEDVVIVIDEVYKPTIEEFKRYNYSLYKEIRGQNRYNDEKKAAIIAYADNILKLLPNYEKEIKKLGHPYNVNDGNSDPEGEDFVNLAHNAEPLAKDIQEYNDSILRYLDSSGTRDDSNGTRDACTKYANLILGQLPAYKNALEKIKESETGDAAADGNFSTSDDTGGAYDSSENDTSDQTSDKLESLEDGLDNLREDVNSDMKKLTLALCAALILLVAALIATIAYFHTKLKKVSQSLATAGPAVQENAGKETRTANGKVQKEMNDLRQHLYNVESQVKRVSAGIGNLEYRLNQSYPQPAPPTLQPAPLTPQPASPTPPMNNGICLYAELDAASNGGLLYKAQPTRTANSLYEITLTQPGATVGSFRVLEDCTILANVLRNRNSYLAACIFNGNDNATKIVNEAPGAVSKQPNGTWLVTKKAKIKLS